MRRTILLPAAYILDEIGGDPEWFPHPVRLMGLVIDCGDRLLNRPNRSGTFNFVTGSFLTLSLVASSFFTARVALRRLAARSHPLGSALELMLAWNCLASKSLCEEANSVLTSLSKNDLPQARLNLARIVGRDTALLGVSEISRAVVETIAESASDGIIAPMFYLAIGGVPLAFAYKAINTLDSMIGHADHRYLYFGKFAARLDDVANYLPARLTALAIVATALLTHADTKAATATWLRDARLHKSPNAGQPESAMSGALKVRLGGSNSYAGEVASSALIGAEFASAEIRHIAAAIHILRGVSLLGLATVTLFAAASRRST